MAQWNIQQENRLRAGKGPKYSGVLLHFLSIKRTDMTDMNQQLSNQTLSQLLKGTKQSTTYSWMQIVEKR